MRKRRSRHRTTTRRRPSTHRPGLNQSRNRLARRQRKSAMSKDLQSASDLARVRSKADPATRVATKDVVEDGLGAAELFVVRLALGVAAAPELVGLGEAVFESEGAGEERGEARAARARVARAHGDALAQQLFDGWREGAVGG